MVEQAAARLWVSARLGVFYWVSIRRD